EIESQKKSAQWATLLLDLSMTYYTSGKWDLGQEETILGSVHDMDIGFWFVLWYQTKLFLLLNQSSEFQRPLTS
ncbi:MAG: hypothetical protein AAF242_21315, partial [Bacteroidota bacterium]